MTIGPMPPNLGLIRDRTGGPAVAPLTAADASSGDPDGFAQALQAIAADDPRNRRIDGTPMRATVERFDERGFFADAGALPGPVVAATAPAGAWPVTGACPAIAQVDDRMPLAAPVDTGDIRLGPPSPPTNCGIGTTGGATPSGQPAAPLPLPRPAGAAPATAATPPFPLPLPIVEPASVGLAVGPARPGKPHQPADVSAKIPVSAVIAAGDDAAAVTIAAHGLTPREIDALRTEIAALLRRHGLTLDDLRLNGRPLGQRRNDQTGH